MSAPPVHRRPLALGLITGGLCLVFYLLWLQHWPLWDAELWTARAVGSSLDHLLTAVRTDRHPPLYFVICWLSARVVPGDAGLRLPSALAAAAAVGLVGWLAGRRLGPGWGWSAALLLGLSPYTVSLAANARSGSLTLLLAAWMVAATLSLHETERPRRAALGLGLAATLGLYTHYDLVLAWVACLASLWWAPASRPRARLGAMALVVAMAAFVPWVIWGNSPDQLVPEAGRSLGQRLFYLRFLLWPLGRSFTPLASWVLLGLGAVGLGVSLRHTRWRGWVLAWLVAGLCVPWLWNQQGSTVAKTYLYAPLLPGAVLLATVGLRRLLPWPKVGSAAGAVLALGLWLPSLLTLSQARSHLLAIWPPTGQGVFDARLEARALVQLQATHHPPDTSGQFPPPQLDDWQRYQPEIAATPDRRTHWRVLSDQAQPAPGQGDLPGCTFDSGFSQAVVLLRPEDCRALGAEVEALSPGYGPFLLQASSLALARGNRQRAVQLALQAHEASPTWPRPSLHLVHLLRGEHPQQALDQADQGFHRALRYRYSADALELAELRVALEAEGTAPVKDSRRSAQRRCVDIYYEQPWMGLCRWFPRWM